MNNTIAPFNDVRVRQALNYATPRDDIVQTAYFGFATPMKSSIPSIFPGYTEEFWVYDFNLDKARELLTAAGYGDGFSTTLYYDAFLPVHEDVAVLMRDAYAQVGVNLTLQRLPAAVFAERLQTSDLPFYLHEEMPVFPNVHYAHFLFYTTDSFVNYSKYSNAQVDQLTLRGLSTFDVDEQLEIGRQVQRILMEDPPAVFVVFPGHQLAVRNNVGDYRWYGTDHATWQYLTVR
jgi:peptide/nickel transport system substrate-binding protein